MLTNAACYFNHTQIASHLRSYAMQLDMIP